MSKHTKIQVLKFANTKNIKLIVIFENMKKFVILFVLAIIFGLGYLYTKGLGTENPLEEGSLETEVSAGEKSLLGVTDRANMVMVASVGLGREERRKVISGRLYQNFVQLLKTNGVMDDKLTFSDDCNTGARLEFYRDTVLVGEYRLTDRIGKDSSDGVWLPRRISKVYKFLRDQGAQLMACNSNGDVSITKLDSAENTRPDLSMPKFGKARNARKNMERDAALDSVARVAVVLSQLNSAVEENAQMALSLLDEMIMAQDTAVGEPLSSVLKKVSRMEVSFLDSTGKEMKKVELTAEQRDDLKTLLNRGEYETFAVTGESIFVERVRVSLYKGTENLGKLVPLNSKYGHWVKKIRQENDGLTITGHWVSVNPDALKAFFSIFSPVL